MTRGVLMHDDDLSRVWLSGIEPLPDRNASLPGILDVSIHLSEKKVASVRKTPLEVCGALRF